MGKRIDYPLDEYKNEYRTLFETACEEKFKEMTDFAKVDLEANCETCKKLYVTETLNNEVKKKLNKVQIIFWVLLTMSGVVAILRIISGFKEVSDIITAFTALVVIVALLIKVRPYINELKEQRDNTNQVLTNLKEEAWNQMQPLNNLYNWDLFATLASSVLPAITFDPYFTTQRLSDLQHEYGWSGDFNKNRSVLYSHSGLINGNPFIICHTRKMEWGVKTYTGRAELRWKTRELGIDGQFHTEEHTEELVAYYDADCPYYIEETHLIYGHNAAPNLIFTREHSGLAGNEDSKRFKKTMKELIKKSQDLKNEDYAMLSNNEFEVAFNTSDRNNNHEYAFLFTPLAQNNMMKLLKDSELGYGDDFDFYKSNKINWIYSEHMQDLNLDMNPMQFHHFDYVEAKNKFMSNLTEYFRAVYFNLAPLLCIPNYQETRQEEKFYGLNMKKESSFWEHEAIANAWGEENFRHAECSTPCILKTKQESNADGSTTIHVSAEGFQEIPRTAYVTVRGKDNCDHDVKVEWIEYVQVIGNRDILIKEDNKPTITDTVQHFANVRNVLSDTGMDSYRRHIASKLL